MRVSRKAHPFIFRGSYPGCRRNLNTFLNINRYMGGFTRRQFLVASAILGAAQLIPSPSLESTESAFEPGRHVFVVGDLHIARDNPEEKREALVSALEFLSGGREGFHLIFNGDIVDFPNLKKTCGDGGWQWEEFARIYEALNGKGFRQHLVLGNHDGEEKFARNVLRGLAPREGIGNSSFIMENGAKFILLSALHPDYINTGFFASERKGFGKRVALATHYPPDKLVYNPRMEEKKGDVGYVLWVKKNLLHSLSKRGIPVICSHSHAPFDGEYSSKELRKKVRVIATPACTYPLPYRGTEIAPPRVLGITVVDTQDFSWKAKFFDGKKAFRPAQMAVESRRGKYLPPMRIQGS